jgi:hypothetical protein
LGINEKKEVRGLIPLGIQGALWEFWSTMRREVGVEMREVRIEKIIMMGLGWKEFNFTPFPALCRDLSVS